MYICNTLNTAIVSYIIIITQFDGLHTKGGRYNGASVEPGSHLEHGEVNTSITKSDPFIRAQKNVTGDLGAGLMSIDTWMQIARYAMAWVRTDDVCVEIILFSYLYIMWISATLFGKC